MAAILFRVQRVKKCFASLLQGHHDEMFVLEHNPSDARIMLSAGHDGYIILWDIVAGVQITQFFNNVRKYLPT